MNNFKKQLAVGIATAAALVHAGLVLPVFATGITVNISGNGSGSTNNVTYTQTNNNTVNQTNNTTVTNTVNATSDTGGNDANDNTGGDEEIGTGDATTHVTVNTATGTNNATVDSCGCPDQVTVNVTDNGHDSDNAVAYTTSNTNFVTQINTATVTNNIDVEAETGDNDANDNTGGSVWIDTGDAWATTNVTNNIGSNNASIGGSTTGGALALVISGNGSDSESDVTIGSTASNVLNQTNTSTLLNNVEVESETGDNDANDNTGGDVEIDTGNATVGATVDNAVGFNIADVGDCCITDGTVTVSGNGEDSDNDFALNLTNTTFDTQGNTNSTTNGVDAEAETGDNDTNDNTSGDVFTDTGNSTNNVFVTNDSDMNIFTQG